MHTLVPSYILEYVQNKIAASAIYYNYLQHTKFCLFSTESDGFEGGFRTFIFQINSPPLSLPCNVVVRETIEYRQNEFRTINLWSSVNGKQETIIWSVNSSDLIHVEFPIQVYNSIPINTIPDTGFRIF